MRPDSLRFGVFALMRSRSLMVSGSTGIFLCVCFSTGLGLAGCLVFGFSAAFALRCFLYARRKWVSKVRSLPTPAQAGARLPDRRPGVRTPGRDTPPPGAMRNLRVPENADSGDWWQRVEHPPAGRFCLAGLNHGKRAPARWRSTAPRRRPDTRPRQGVSK